MFVIGVFMFKKKHLEAQRPWKKAGFHQKDFFLSGEFATSKVGDSYLNGRLDFQGKQIFLSYQPTNPHCLASRSGAIGVYLRFFCWQV